MNATNCGAGIARGRGLSLGRARLAKQIEQLARASDECFAAAYVELVSCLEHQMREEEAVMEAINSRALRSHQEQHARALAAMNQAEPRIEQGNVRLGRQALALLDQWLPLQCASTDMALLVSLTPMGRQRPLEALKLDAGDRRRRLRPSQPDGNTFVTA